MFFKKNAKHYAAKADIYKTKAVEFANGDKPWEQGLTAIFTKAAISATEQSAYLQDHLAHLLMYKLRPKKVAIDDAEEALALFDELAKLKNPALGKTHKWEWACPVPSAHEQTDIAKRMCNVVQLDIERLGLKGLADVQKHYLARGTFTKASHDMTPHDIPAWYVDERTIARSLFGIKSTASPVIFWS